jgi:hypothetical protein
VTDAGSLCSAKVMAWEVGWNGIFEVRRQSVFFERVSRASEKGCRALNAETWHLSFQLDNPITLRGMPKSGNPTKGSGRPA